MKRRIDLCRQIFEIQPAYRTKKCIYSINSNSILYNVVDTNVKFLKHKHAAEAVTYQDLFSLANFNPSFDGKITSKLLSYIPQNQTEIEIIIIHLLFASASLFYFYDNSMEIQNCADFFQLICKFPNSLYQDLIASAISEVYLICVSLDFDTHFDLILSTLSEYINTINLNPTNLISKIIDSIEVIAKKTDYEKNSHGPTFLTFLTTVIADHTEFFTNEMYDNLFRIIQPYILQLHENCLNIFYLIHKNLDLTLISEFVNNFFERICTEIESESPYYDVLSIDSLELELEKSPMYQMIFPQRKTFQNGFILPDIVQKSGESKNIINPKYQDKVSLVFKIISNIESAYIALLFKFITKVKIAKDTKYYFDYCGLLVLYLLIGRIQIEKSDFPIPEFIGNPKISTSNTNNLYSMRFFFLYLILINFNQDLDKFLLQMAHFPILFSEYLHILMNLMADLIPYIQNHTNIIQTLASISIQLQLANFKANENISEIESCRLTLFKLFEDLLDKDDIMIQFFANPLFTSHIISLLYEENVREFALSKLCRYISISETLPCLISIINPLFDQISNYSISDDRQQSILLMIIKSINNNARNIQLFVDFTDQLTIVLKSLTKTEFSEEIVLEIIKLFVTMSQETCLKHHWVEDLEFCYNQLDLHDERSFIGMESLLLGKNVDSIVLNVEIKNDFVFPIIFRIFYRKKEDLMQYFISLCNYSNINARLMHFSKLDLEIIKIFEQDSSDDELLELFYHISSVSSSPQIVQQFLALFSLIHKRFVRPRSNYVNLLSKLLIDIQGKPEMSLSLSERHEFNFSSEFNQFAISFWLNLTSTSQGTIISLSRNDSDEEKLLMIKEKDFLCKGYRINTKISFSKWIFVVLSLKNSTLRIFIDSDQISNIKISQNVKNFNKLIIGNLTDDNDYSSQISNVVISDLLSVQKIQEYYRKGPRSMFQFDNPIFAVSYSLISKIQKNVDRKFANILLRFFRVNILLPLFAQLDLEMIDFKSVQYLMSKYTNKIEEKKLEKLENEIDQGKEKISLENLENFDQGNNEKPQENVDENEKLEKIYNENIEKSQENVDENEKLEKIYNENIEKSQENVDENEKLEKIYNENIEKSRENVDENEKLEKIYNENIEKSRENVDENEKLEKIYNENIEKSRENVDENEKLEKIYNENIEKSRENVDENEKLEKIYNENIEKSRENVDENEKLEKIYNENIEKSREEKSEILQEKTDKKLEKFDGKEKRENDENNQEKSFEEKKEISNENQDEISQQNSQEEITENYEKTKDVDQEKSSEGKVEKSKAILSENNQEKSEKILHEKTDKNEEKSSEENSKENNENNQEKSEKILHEKTDKNEEKSSEENSKENNENDQEKSEKILHEKTDKNEEKSSEENSKENNENDQEKSEKILHEKTDKNEEKSSEENSKENNENNQEKSEKILHEKTDKNEEKSSEENSKENNENNQEKSEKILHEKTDKNEEKSSEENSKENNENDQEKSEKILHEKTDKNEEKSSEENSKENNENNQEKSKEIPNEDDDKTEEEIPVDEKIRNQERIREQLEKRKKIDELIINELLTKSKNDQIDVSNLTILPNDVSIIDIISLLSLALYAGEKEEIDFVSNDGTKILSHLLTSLNHFHLTIDCYKSLFLVVETSLTEDIKNSMMKDILLNFNIWRFSPDQTQIYSYLSEKIFEYSPTLICQNLSLNKLLNTIRIYFWYDRLEIHNDDRKVTDITEVRKFLFNFGLNIAWHSLTMKSFKKIISHIITVPDDRQRKDLLQFLLSVTSHNSIIFNLGTQVLTFSKQLNSLFNSDDEEIIFLTISSISALLYCFPEMKPKFVTFATSLDQIIPQRKFGVLFLQKIVSILPAFPELFKFITFVSMNSRNSLVYDVMEPSIKFTTIDYWYKYSIVHAINDKESQIFTFLCKCKLENTFEFAMMTDLICRSINKDQYHYLSLLISASLHFAFDSRAKTPLMNNLVNIAFHFIFFHDGFAKTNKNIDYLFEKSPFSDKERMILSSRSNPNIASFSPKRNYKNISKSNPNLTDLTDSVDDSDEKLQRFFLDDSETDNSLILEKNQEIPENSEQKTENQNNNEKSDKNSEKMSENVKNIQEKINEKENSSNNQSPDKNTEKLTENVKNQENSEENVKFSENLSENVKISDEEKSKISQNNETTSINTLLNENTKSSDNLSENDKTPNSSILNESENMSNSNLSESERFISDSNISESDLSEQINHSEVEKLQLNLTDQLIKKYRFVPTKEQFSLRISDKKGKWEDFSLSLLLLKIFSVYKLDNVHSFSSIVLYFLHQSNDVGKQIANDLYRDNVKVLSDDNSGYFVMFRDKITGKFSTNSFNILNDINKFNNFNYNDHFLAEIKSIRKNINYLSVNSIKVLPNSLPPEIFNFEEKISNFYNEIQSFKNENRKKWHIFWSNASQGPFMNKNEQKTKRFKRDESLFYCMCPWRLKINRKFDDHTKESIARELGNSQKQEEAMKMFKEKENEEKVTLPKLLEIVDTKTKENKVEGNENQISEFDCELITIKKCQKCKFIICKSFLMIENNFKKTKIVYFHEISRILQRPKFQRITAIEIFTKSGRSYFVNFTQRNLPKVIKSLTYHLTNENILIQKTSNFAKFFSQQNLTEKWLNYELSNFEYLMLINVFSGRSFSDSSQYPFMPWTLKEFKKSNLDLADVSNYRDLTLPIGQVDKERYEMLKQRVDLGQTNFLYSSFCVSPLSLFLWLIRTEPFTTLHTEMQSGKFDVPSRIFKSISEAYKLATTRINDYRELIPEFFYFPEFLLNLNGFDFGQVRDEKVDDVKLPPWSKNAVEFVYKMRESLESDYVSENINNWIDFYFGVDQKKENNLFCETCYSGIWTKELLKNKEQRDTIEAQMTLLGQFPQQIFTQKHPKRKPRKDIINDMRENNKLKISENKIKSASINEHLVTILSENEIKVIEINPENFKIMKNYLNENVEIVLNENLYLTKTYSIQSFNNTNDKIVDLVNVSCYSLKRKSKIVVSYDSILNIFKDNFTISVPFYGESIKCCDVSTEYGLVICGTSSFSVNICKLNDGSKIQTLDLDFCPNFVLITNKWGFIYCLDKTGNIMGSTLNGTVFMRNNHFGKEITCLTSFSSNFGFDYIALAYEDGKIVVFDAFYGMNEGNKQSFRCYSKVISLKYLYDLKCLCAITENGFIHFFYVQL
ncbi:Beige/BEACH domain containing protein [Trichomonas vaginalis G3]|uniref:Beige/BEACH domain containing protein n=1 Tax=Trichomonas vaginalis (strain ATCC PRA-98 / G3) TaxID=412133 RepID=A2G287_TRIV3|nr:beige/BEACH-related family [Trichomonas vaginalis G3]EAX88735.1 Beige/BEACH domain containing protein [Trichomonas vaginalis G3]KAI5483164.1 beige/BEACH-related family [Trichomonas vaginalis G3]|eukprot:XP_001301665.1 Beige/BEACH domain containing protein [Trichomonas vaginalis G3]